MYLFILNESRFLQWTLIVQENSLCCNIFTYAYISIFILFTSLVHSLLLSHCSLLSSPILSLLYVFFLIIKCPRGGLVVKSMGCFPKGWGSIPNTHMVLVPGKPMSSNNIHWCQAQKDAKKYMQAKHSYNKKIK